MNWKTWLLLLLALAAGSVASFGVKTAFFVEKDAQAEVKSDDFAPKERLLVAKGALVAGTELNAQNVRLTLTPERDAPRDGIFTFEGISGRKIVRDLKDGEAISIYDLDSSEETQAEDASFVPPGCVVVPIEICSATKAAGGVNYLKITKLNDVVKPGDVVDLLVVKEDDSSYDKRRLISEPVAENVSVFAVRDEKRHTAEGLARSSVLSALLSKEQVESVRKASEEGKIKIVFHSTDGLSYEESQEESDFLSDDLYSSAKNNDAIFGRRTDDVFERPAQAFDATNVASDASGSLLDQDVEIPREGAASAESKDEEGVFMNVSRKVRIDPADDEASREKDDVLSNADALIDGALIDGALIDGEDAGENLNPASLADSDGETTSASESELGDRDGTKDVKKRPRIYSPYATRGTSVPRRRAVSEESSTDRSKDRVF